MAYFSGVPLQPMLIDSKQFPLIRKIAFLWGHQNLTLPTTRQKLVTCPLVTTAKGDLMVLQKLNQQYRLKNLLNTKYMI